METPECARCRRSIEDAFFLKAVNQVWHEDCLRCHCCDCRLAEVGTSLFARANLLLCRRDYLRLFGSTGLCAACHKHIPAFEMVMRTRDNCVYHLECFSCQHCDQRFCVGDRYYIVEARILCERDYEELLLIAASKQLTSGVDAFAVGGVGDGAATIANLAVQPHSRHATSAATYDALSQLKLQTERMLPSASGAV